MLVRTLVASVAAFAAIAVTGPARAADIPAAKVHYSDLDLATTDGEAALKLRIARAAKTVCWREDGPTLNEHARFDACRDAAIAGASPKMNRVIASARSDHRYAMNNDAIAMPGR